MPRFRFVHAADLHIDSPLIGLAGRSEAFAERIDQASRQAFDNLVSLAQEEQCSFILIAGDLFDGQWRDYHTGAFFLHRMRRLKDLGIRVFIVMGNHDAENRFARRLEFSDNVHVLSADQAETILLHDVKAAIHGRSFPRRDVTENLAAGYLHPVPGYFNIGILHTALTGREGHEPYAPCNVQELVNRGYDYWALGHIHAQEVISRDPYIVFPGNLQGRHVRETGPKGAALVTVDDGYVAAFEHRPLDVIRWSREELNVSECTDLDAINGLARERLEDLTDEANGRGLAARLRICGRTSLHHEIVKREVQLGDDLRTMAQTVGDIWIEKLEFNTSPLERNLPDPTIAGRLQAVIDELSVSEDFRAIVSTILNEVRNRTPHGVADEEFYWKLIEQLPERAAELAKATVAGGEE
jgi:DNA repair exonuclease SbcCD nuclease subunit